MKKKPTLYEDFMQTYRASTGYQNSAIHESVYEEMIAKKEKKKGYKVLPEFRKLDAAIAKDFGRLRKTWSKGYLIIAKEIKRHKKGK
jgi:hypothetical protein